MTKIFKKVGSRLALWVLILSNFLMPMSYASADDLANISSAGATFTFTMPDFLVSLFAHSEANPYTIKFNGNTGTGAGMADLPMTYGSSKKLTKNTFTKTGYTFLGWNENSSATTQHYADEQSVSNLTTGENAVVNLYAIWKANIYEIAFDKNEGADTINKVSGTMNNQSVNYDSEVNLTANAYTRPGYSFQGWSTSANSSSVTYQNSGKVKNLAAGSGAVVTLYAVWKANTNTPYKVEHYWMNVDGNGYTLHETQNLTGTTYAEVSPTPKTYLGFTSPANATTVRIKGDGSTVITYQYTRNKYTLSFNANGGTSASSREVYYGAAVGELPVSAQSGYDFVGWFSGSVDVAANQISSQTTMPAGNLQVTAKWSPRPDTKYMVYHMLKNVGENTYTLSGALTQTLSGVTQSDLTLANLQRNIEGFNYAAGSTTSGSSLPTNMTTTKIIKDGSTKVYLYYNRNKHKVTVNTGTGVVSVSGGANEVEYGAPVTIGATLSDCYYWSNWTGYAVSNNQSYSFTMPNEDVSFTPVTTIKQFDLTVTTQTGAVAEVESKKYNCGSTVTLKAHAEAGYDWAQWRLNGIDGDQETIRNDATTSFTMPAKNVSARAEVTPRTDTKYVVKHQKETLNGEYNDTNAEIENLTGTTAATVTPAVKSYEGFTAPQVQSGKINGDGSLVIVYKYSRKSYTLTINNGDGIQSSSGANSYKFEQPVSLSATVKDGYNGIIWSGDYATPSFTMPAKNVTINVYSTPVTYTITYKGLEKATLAYKPTSYTVKDNDIVIGAPSRTGYTFAGWTGTNLTSAVQSVTIKKGSTGNREYTATWTANDVPITVNHYLQNLDGTYPDTPYSTTTSQVGKADSTITAALLSNLVGFNAPTPQQVEVKPDGSTVVNYQYTRQSYAVSITKGEGIASVSGAGDYLYDQQVTLSAELAPGYKDIVWSGDKATNSFKMPAANVAVTASATPIVYTITYNVGSGTISNETKTYTVKSENFNLVQPTRTGYTFLGWTGEGISTPTKVVTIAKGSIGNRTYTANWSANDVTVKVTHKRMDLDGTYNNTSLHEEEILQKKADSSVEIEGKDYGAGFTKANSQTVTVNPDGTTAVELLYPRNKFALSLTAGTGVATVTGSGNYYYQQAVSVSATLKSGYENLTWTGDESKSGFNMPAANVAMTANASPITYTITYNTVGGNIQGERTTYNVETPDFTLVKPTKTGYDFGGWTGTNVSTPTVDVVVAKGSTGNRTYTAKWNPRNDTAYTVHHLVKEVGKTSYKEELVQHLTGTTDAELTLASLSQALPCATYATGSLTLSTTGLPTDTIAKTTITPDGQRNVYLYYSRNVHNVELSGDSNILKVEGAQQYECGATVTVKATAKEGYHFLRWENRSSNANG